MENTCGIILLDKTRERVLLMHPTGSRHTTRTLPKGLAEPGEEYVVAAAREFAEETDNDIYSVASGLVYIGAFRYANKKKTLHAFGAVATGDFQRPIRCVSTFDRRGVATPECDYHEWVILDDALKVMHHTAIEALRIYMQMLKLCQCAWPAWYHAQYEQDDNKCENCGKRIRL